MSHDIYQRKRFCSFERLDKRLLAHPDNKIGKLVSKDIPQLLLGHHRVVQCVMQYTRCDHGLIQSCFRQYDARLQAVHHIRVARLAELKQQKPKVSLGGLTLEGAISLHKP